MATMQEIQRLERTRQALWRKAGDGSATAADRERIKEITDKLYILWDKHRREVAGVRWGRTSPARRENIA